MGAERSHWSFLFRTDEGRIDAGTWWRNAGLLTGIFVVLTLAWVLVAPFAEHDLAKQPLFTVSVFAANLYRIVYGFAVIILLICYYNLSAKRWRDIGRPPALAGLLPFVACLAGALHWVAPRSAGAVPHSWTIVADCVLFLVFVWNVVDLGDLRPRSRRN
ncbi:MAG: hypothetical protein EPN75_02685 [Beijerinckiaceae bacterium]|nr:MAG: hypothetical protein EPN75_02685 [Beijerinckiaceae bacterium]